MSTKPQQDQMWAEACEMLERAERLRRQFFKPSATRTSGPTWEPPVDVVETETEVAVVVALPGVEAKALEIGIDGDVLTVRGVRPLPTAFRRARIHRLELPYGHFERRIGLMWDRLTLVKRDLADGCLVLVFRKRN